MGQFGQRRNPFCRMIRITASLAAWPFLAAAVLLAQFFPEMHGEWGQRINQSVLPEYRLSLQESRAFGQKLESLAAILREAQVFNPPLGFQPRLHARFWYPQDCRSGSKTCNDWAVQAQAVLIVYYFVKENGKITWGGNANTSAGIRVNDLLSTLDQDYDLGYGGLPLPDGRHISYMPSKSAEVAGFPIFEDKRLILAKTSRPFWVPVTREQYLAALIRFRSNELGRAEERIAQPGPYEDWAGKREERRKARQQIYKQMKKTDPAKAEEVLRQSEKMEAEMEAALKSSTSVFAGSSESLQPLRDGIDSLRAELANMSRDDRASQAWVAGPLADPGSRLVPDRAPNARPLIAVNPDFFDRSRSRADWQLTVITFGWGGYQPDHIGVRRLREFCATTDWKRVFALMN